MLRVDEGADAAALLRLGDGVERKRRLAGGFRPVDLDHPAARQAADAERHVEADRAGGDGGDLHHLAVLAEPHDGALAERALDLARARRRAPSSCPSCPCCYRRLGAALPWHPPLTCERRRFDDRRWRICILFVLKVVKNEMHEQSVGAVGGISLSLLPAALGACPRGKARASPLHAERFQPVEMPGVAIARRRGEAQPRQPLKRESAARPASPAAPAARRCRNGCRRRTRCWAEAGAPDRSDPACCPARRIAVGGGEDQADLLALLRAARPRPRQPPAHSGRRSAAADRSGAPPRRRAAVDSSLEKSAAGDSSDSRIAFTALPIECTVASCPAFRSWIVPAISSSSESFCAGRLGGDQMRDQIVARLSPPRRT